MTSRAWCRPQSTTVPCGCARASCFSPRWRSACRGTDGSISEQVRNGALSYTTLTRGPSVRYFKTAAFQYRAPEGLSAGRPKGSPAFLSAVTLGVTLGLPRRWRFQLSH
jgi:hypothetical protein